MDSVLITIGMFTLVAVGGITVALPWFLLGKLRHFGKRIDELEGWREGEDRLDAEVCYGMEQLADEIEELDEDVADLETAIFGHDEDDDAPPEPIEASEK